MKSRDDTLAELMRCRDEMEKLRLEIETKDKGLTNLPAGQEFRNKHPRIFAIRNNRGEWKLASSRLHEDAGDERRVGKCEAIVTRARTALGYASDNDLLDRLLVHLKQNRSGSISLLQCYLDVGFARVPRSFLTPTGFVIGSCENALEEWLSMKLAEINADPEPTGVTLGDISEAEAERINQELKGFGPEEIRRLRLDADSQSAMRRWNGRPGPEAKKQEDLLSSARDYAHADFSNWVLGFIADEVKRKPSLWEDETATELLENIKKRAALKAWTEFIPPHAERKDFWRLTFEEFAAALWREGIPRLEDLAIDAIIEYEPQEKAAGVVAAKPGTTGKRSHYSPAAAIRVEEYRTNTKAMDLTDFAGWLGINPKTYRNFCKTGYLRRSALKDIATRIDMPYKDLVNDK
jgi:hypothetical protein